MRVSEQDLEIMECNNANVIPDFILDDKGMNKEEQQESFMKYIRFGYHHPSMTKQAEERAALTDMSLVPNQAIPEKDIADQFDIEHSSTQAQAHLKSVKKHVKAFSKHPFDLRQGQRHQDEDPHYH